MDIMELCRKNYGRTWTAEMLATLVEKGKLTPGQYQELTGKAYSPHM